MIDVIEGEEWFETPSPYDSYLASTLGRCYNVRRGWLMEVKRYRREKHLPPQDCYSLQSLYTDPQRLGRGRGTRTTGRYIRVGVLVYRTFIGPIGTGWTVARIDRDPHPWPWRLENLQRVSGRWAFENGVEL